MRWPIVIVSFVGNTDISTRFHETVDSSRASGVRWISPVTPMFDGADGDDIVPRCLLQERVELAGVGDNALAGERAKERDEHLFEVGPLREGSEKRQSLGN